MQYKIERAKTMGTRQPHFYLNGWVHSNNYKIRVLCNSEQIVETGGFIPRTDVAKKFGESEKAANVYGFYCDVKVPVDAKRIEIFLETEGERRRIKVVRDCLILRYWWTALARLRSLIKRLHVTMHRCSYVFEVLAHPNGWGDKEYRLFVKDKYRWPMPDELVLPWVPGEYNSWLKKYEKNEKPQKLDYQPKISILVPVYNPPEELLSECIDSVLGQTYSNFELCLADDCSPDPNVKKILEKFAKKDKRIKVVFREKNGGISEATNSALAIAEGEFVALLDNDDVLAPNALYENVKVLNERNGALDFIYSDEDMLNLNGERFDWRFRTDWAPDTLMSYNYITHFAVLRTSIMRELGGFITKHNGAQDYDMFLRFTEKTTAERIYHIPKVLYHWRMSATSTAFSIGTKNYAVEAGRSALEAAMKRRRAKGEALVYHNTCYLAKYACRKDARTTIVVRMHCSLSVARQCIKNLRQKVGNKHEIIVVGPKKSKTVWRDFYQELERKEIKTIFSEEPTDYAKLENEAAKVAKGEFLIFMDDFVMIRDKKTLGEMMGVATQAHIGVMSGRTSDDKYIWQGAPVLGAGYLGIVKDSFAKVKRDSDDPRINITHNYSTVATTCLMVRKKVFEDCQGFDEKLGEEYATVDLCLKALNKGYFNVVTPYIDVYQPKISDSYRRVNRLIDDAKYLKNKWGVNTFKNDRFYNPNFSLRYFYTLKNDEGK